MKIAVLSGKGGTGKTTVSSNLAAIINNTTLVDCDVEEPNAHLFFETDNMDEQAVRVEYPVVDMDKCTLCGDCGDFCNFNALLPAKNSVLVFKESCHSCGGCEMVCPEHAISFALREIGVIKSGAVRNNLALTYGVLNIGELSAVRVIEAVLDSVEDKESVIIDSPPGTSCATVAAVNDADYAIIVTEPTPFGISDMKMVVQMLREMKIPFSVVINKSGLGGDEIYHYLDTENISILGEIPFNKEIAKLYATGGLISDKLPQVRNIFQSIVENLNSTLDTTIGASYADI